LVNTQAYQNYEGIIETDAWFGPLFTNIRMTRTNAPVEFHKRYPLFQVQPIPRPAYRDPGFDIFGSTDMTVHDWAQFEATIRPNTDQMRRLGSYAADTRKRLRREEAGRQPELGVKE
jgi:hypothetical protein